jgi:hypothetical protein
MRREPLPLNPFELGVAETNQLACEHVRRWTNAIQPSDCIVYDDVSLQPHDTLVVMLPPEYQQLFADFADELQAIDPGLQLNAPDRYHMTIVWYPEGGDREQVRRIASDFLAQEPLKLTIANLCAFPEGIAVCAYPDSLLLVRMRQALSEAVGKPFALDDRGVMAWTSLARYGHEPPVELLAYVREHFDNEYGGLAVKMLHCFYVKNRILQDAQELFTVPAAA